MLKKLIIFIIVGIILSGCRPVNIEEEDNTSFNILSFKGTPSLSLLGINNEYINIKITSSNDDIYEAFKESEEDIIIAPINDGCEYSSKYQKYKLLSIVEYGQMYIVSTDENTDDGIVGAIGEDNVIGHICKFLEGTDLHKYEVVWYDSFNDLYNGLVNGELTSIITDEINFNYLTNYCGIELYKVENIQEDIEYQTKFSSYPVYGMFVNDIDLDKYQNSIVTLAKTIKNNISTYKNDKNEFNEVLNSANIEVLGFDNKELISESYNYCGLDFVYANNDKDSLKNILDICDINLDETIIVE